jgi:hypothetical protein
MYGISKIGATMPKHKGKKKKKKMGRMY